MSPEAAILVAPYASCPFTTVRPVDLHEPGPGELLVRIDAAGVWHWDLSALNGSRPRPTPHGARL
ncbi:hypothetical protein ACFV42_49050 [Streptomyces solisilvae]|uniref:hypothetical protein n=1 Tax=Streptomyces malaysiensis TaxID=92644 RepID=UPI0036C8AE9C